jgi:xanthine dehydrogenase YagR molybdenum-binding subunit
MSPPVPRADAIAKVTGSAQYLADLPFDGLDGAFLTSSIARGRILSIDATAARGMAGVTRVFLPGELPRIGPIDHWAAGQANLPLMDDRIRHEGQPVALVLATNGLVAAEATGRIEVRFRSEPARASLEGWASEAVEVEDWAASATEVGSVETGLAAAAVVVEGRYRTADRHHAALEPAAVIARWHGSELEVWVATQWVFGVRAALGSALGIPVERIRVRTPFVGGGFGAKGSTWPIEILAAIAAREVGRPVRIVLPRSQTFTLHGYQPATEQAITLGATGDGRLTAIRHHGISAGATGEDYVEHTSVGSRSLYACPNIETRDRIVRLDRPQPTFMRAPHEGPGMVGLEIAMDELAVALALDPVELRLRNYATVDPTSGKPFSSKALDWCYRHGAEVFGWARRTPAPGSMREGGSLVGWGMASATMSTFRFGSSARVTARRDGTVLVETASHEIGTGVGTMLRVVAAEALGTDPERVEVRLGDTALPEAGGTFGSGTTLGVGSAVRLGALRLMAKLESLAAEPAVRADEYPELLALRGLDQVSEMGVWSPRRGESGHSMHAYGAIFVEVRLEGRLSIPRVTRCVGDYSAGKIINPSGARSQVVGGITWGIGQALLEDSRFDPATARFLAKSLSSYHVPVQSDVPEIEVFFADEYDPHASEVGARGVGEIGAIGVGAAVANAFFHATGIRVRRLPVEVGSRA